MTWPAATWLAVTIAGAAGAACRYVVDFVVTQRLRGAFPWGTWLVNISGALLLGGIAGTALAAPDAVWWEVAVGTGFCGAYTTFSTYMFETLQLVERRAWWDALWNLASLAAGVVAAVAGAAFGAALGR